MAKNDKKETAIVLRPDSSVPEFLTSLNQKISRMKHIADSVYKTNGKVRTASGEMDIKTQTSPAELVKAFSGILVRAQSMEQAYEVLGITNYPVVKIDGGTVEEWKSDIQLRIEIIEQKDQLDELNALKKEAEELMDKEDRKALLLKKMEKFAG